MPREVLDEVDFQAARIRHQRSGGRAAAAGRSRCESPPRSIRSQAGASGAGSGWYAPRRGWAIPRSRKIQSARSSAGWRAAVHFGARAQVDDPVGIAMTSSSCSTTRSVFLARSASRVPTGCPARGPAVEDVEDAREVGPELGREPDPRPRSPERVSVGRSSARWWRARPGREISGALDLGHDVLGCQVQRAARPGFAELVAATAAAAGPGGFWNTERAMRLSRSPWHLAHWARAAGRRISPRPSRSRASPRVDFGRPRGPRTAAARRRPRRAPASRRAGRSRGTWAPAARRIRPGLDLGPAIYVRGGRTRISPGRHRAGALADAQGLLQRRGRRPPGAFKSAVTASMCSL